jgi:hypothetical protein
MISSSSRQEELRPCWLLIEVGVFDDGGSVLNTTQRQLHFEIRDQLPDIHGG